MGRWQKLIEELLQKLGRLTPGGGSLFHDEIDELLREVEEIVERAESVEVLETPKLRQREFEFEVRLVLAERIQREPSNRIWRETMNLLDHPQLRRSRRAET